MPTIAYPVTLTQKDWDKKKPLLAKTKSTGIGEALTGLKKMHDAVSWDLFDLASKDSLSALDSAREAGIKEMNSKLGNIASKARDVATLANKWAADFAKEKLIPKSATKAAKDVADAAADYAKHLEQFGTPFEKEYTDTKKHIGDMMKAYIAPLPKMVGKADEFLKEIASFKSSPNKDTLLSLFAGGDKGARGYCTACKHWDQILATKIPDIVRPIYSGKAMTEFFPAVQNYGANHDGKWWEQTLQEQMAKQNKSEEDVIKAHAVWLGKQEADIKKFKGYLEAVIAATG